MGIFKGLEYLSSSSFPFLPFFPYPTKMCFSSVLVRHVMLYSHTVISSLFSPPSLFLSIFTNWFWLERLPKTALSRQAWEICLALANTGRKRAVQGLAGLGRWRRVLLPKVVGWDSRKLWGKSTLHQPFPSSLGTLLLVPAAEHRSTKQQWVDQTRNHSDLFFLSQATGTPNYALQVAAKGSFLLFFLWWNSIALALPCGSLVAWWLTPHCNCAGSLEWAITFHCSFIWDSFNYMGKKMHLLSFWTPPVPWI